MKSIQLKEHEIDIFKAMVEVIIHRKKINKSRVWHFRKLISQWEMKLFKANIIDWKDDDDFRKL